MGFLRRRRNRGEATNKVLWNRGDLATVFSVAEEIWQRFFGGCEKLPSTELEIVGGETILVIFFLLEDYIGDWMLELCFGISGVYGNFWPSDADAHFGLECSEEQIRIFHKAFMTWNSVYDF